MYYVGARYYDPNIGRFLSFDPATRLEYSGRLNLIEPLSLNPYVYVKNNPIRWIDPLGLWYLNTNFTGCAPVIYLCVTGGYLVNTNVLYPYLGGGVGSPGISFAETYSKSDPTSGLTIGLQGAYGAAGQVSYSFANSERSYEYGEGWPRSISITGSYVFDLGSTLDWLREGKIVEDNIDVDYDEFNKLLLQESINSYYENLQLPWDENYLIDEHK